MSQHPLPHYVGICPTKGRKTVTERVIKCFVDQDYEGPATLLIYNNSIIPQRLGDIKLPANKNIKLVNNYISIKAGQPYTSLGEIYNDCLLYIPEDAEIISHFECDDIYYKSYISQGVKGILRNGCKAWKTKTSFYRTGPNQISLVENLLEPSIFFQWRYLKDIGYEEVTGAQFHKLIEAVSDDFIKEDETPNFIYCWDGEFQVFKTSGNMTAPTNFQDYAKKSQDHGDKILKPWSDERILPYYQEIENYASRD